MKVLVLGGAGMLGHKAFEVLGGRFDTYVTFREPAGKWAGHPLFAGASPGRLIGGLSADRTEDVNKLLQQVRPDAVLNCIGIVKQRDEARMAIPSIRINALFPHELGEMCAAVGARLLHVSSDCVFSGRKGNYSEDDNPDPVDLYGRSKLLGEVSRPGSLTIRTSIIGWELRGDLGLVAWFASQRGRRIKGYRRAIYTGMTTAALVELMAGLMVDFPELSGMHQAAAGRINKYELLLKLRDGLGWKDVEIEPDDAVECDRSLVGARLEQKTGWKAPSWDTMIEGLCREWSRYEKWRQG